MIEEGAFTLTLAGKVIPFRPLVLRQIRRIVPKLIGLRSLAGGAGITEAEFDAMVAIVGIAGEKAEPPFGEAETPRRRPPKNRKEKWQNGVRRYRVL